MSQPRRKQRPLTQADYRRLAQFRYQLRRFLLFSEEAAREAGLVPQHHQALLTIKALDACAVGDLAARLGIRPHSAAELVDRLVAAKLVKRRQDEADRRRVHLKLTASAERVLEKLTVAHRRELKRLADLWGPLFEDLRGTKERKA